MIDDDERLQQNVIDELVAEGNLDASTIGVAVRGGMVELVGKVPSIAEKHIAERAVRRISGVRGIVNKLQTADDREARM